MEERKKLEISIKCHKQTIYCPMIESKHDAHYGFTFIINGGGMRSIIGIKHDVDSGNRRTFCSSINAYIVQVLYVPK